MSELASLLARTRAAADQRGARHREQYERLVRKCAEGDDIPADDILKQLDRWGRDVNDFQNDVLQLAQRIELAAQRIAGTDAAKKVEEVEAAMHEVHRQVAVAVAELHAQANEQLAPLEAQRVEAVRLANIGTEAARRLRETADEDVRAQADAAAKAFNEARNRRDKLSADLLKIATAIADQRERIELAREKKSDLFDRAQRALAESLLAKDVEALAAGLTRLEASEAECRRELTEAERLREESRVQYERVEALLLVA